MKKVLRLFALGTFSVAGLITAAQAQNRASSHEVGRIYSATARAPYGDGEAVQLAQDKALYLCEMDANLSCAISSKRVVCPQDTCTAWATARGYMRTFIETRHCGSRAIFGSSAPCAKKRATEAALAACQQNYPSGCQIVSVEVLANTRSREFGRDASVRAVAIPR